MAQDLTVKQPEMMKVALAEAKIEVADEKQGNWTYKVVGPIWKPRVIKLKHRQQEQQ